MGTVGRLGVQRILLVHHPRLFLRPLAKLAGRDAVGRVGRDGRTETAVDLGLDEGDALRHDGVAQEGLARLYDNAPGGAAAAHGFHFYGPASARSGAAVIGQGLCSGEGLGHEGGDVAGAEFAMVPDVPDIRRGGQFTEEFDAFALKGESGKQGVRQAAPSRIHAFQCGPEVLRRDLAASRSRQTRYSGGWTTSWA